MAPVHMDRDSAGRIRTEPALFGVPAGSRLPVDLRDIQSLIEINDPAAGCQYFLDQAKISLIKPLRQGARSIGEYLKDRTLDIWCQKKNCQGNQHN